LKLGFALWTREAVATLIQRETGVWLSALTINAYLRAGRFTAQQPMKRATEWREPAIRHWLNPNFALFLTYRVD
jgi:transposase